MSNDIIKYGKLLGALIGHSIRGTEPVSPTEDIDWKKLYHLAALHNVTALIYPAIAKLDIPQEVKTVFEHLNHRLMAREARQEIESHRVFTALDEARIPFIKLKGIVIKNLYPMPHMRSASDVDICLTKKGRTKAKAVMEDLGYTLDSSIDYHDEYSKDRFFIYELHSDVISSRSPLHGMFVNPFEKAVKDSEAPNQLVLTNEYFYLNLVAHLYKHFISEGCGLRLFCDIYVFRRKCTKLDTTFITNALKDYNLLEFHNHVLQLITCFFEGNTYSDKLLTVAEFIFKSGEYGNSELKKLAWLSSDKSANLTFFDKVRYFFGNWFPGVKVMEKRYPVLKKAPFLLPVCWIRRVFYTVFFKHSAIKVQKEEIKRLNSKELKEAKRIRALVGIK